MFNFIESIITWKMFKEVTDSLSAKTLTPTDLMVISTIFTYKLYERKVKKKIVGFSELTRADSVLFSIFVIRALVIGGVENRSSAEKFSSEFVSKAIKSAENLFIPKSISPLMISNRFEMYEKAFTKASLIEDKLREVLDVFIACIRCDIRREMFFPVNLQRPDMLLDYQEENICDSIIENYLVFLLKSTDEMIVKTQIYLS